MPKSQFRILYRQFLFRMVDVELLSADALGDMNKLLGQFAALLVFIGIGLTWFGFIALGGHANHSGLVTFNRICLLDQETRCLSRYHYSTTCLLASSFVYRYRFRLR
jgi:hypothetical protein